MGRRGRVARLRRDVDPETPSAAIPFITATRLLGGTSNIAVATGIANVCHTTR